MIIANRKSKWTIKNEKEEWLKSLRLEEDKIMDDET